MQTEAGDRIAALHSNLQGTRQHHIRLIRDKVSQPLARG